MLDKLKTAAQAAAEKAYAPYSGFRVGAAILTDDGSIFTGCNVENASYGLTVCAERNAVFAAVGAGKTKLLKCVVYVDSDLSFPPCGACRQVLAEFANNMQVIWFNRVGLEYSATLDELIPGVFSLSGNK